VCAWCNPRPDTSGLKRRAGIPLAEVRASKAGPRGAQRAGYVIGRYFGNERRDEEGGWQGKGGTSVAGELSLKSQPHNHHHD
jgi:hypothetical protein